MPCRSPAATIAPVSASAVRQGDRSTSMSRLPVGRWSCRHDLRCLVDGKACAVGSRDRHRLVEDCAAERLDIIASENSLPLESERRNPIPIALISNFRHASVVER